MSKIILITGASSGLGKELRDLYLKRGNIVCCLSRSNPDNYENHFFCDVTDETSVNSAIKSVSQKFGKIDILYVNSGVGINGALELLPSETVKNVMDINFFGAFYTIKYALPFMPKGGKIINISSVCAVFALPFRSMYCASKAALNLLSMSINMELVGRGVTSTSVCPGEIKTEFTKNRIKNFETNEFYGDKVKTSVENIEKKENTRMSVNYVAKEIIKLADKKHTKPFYLIGKKYKVFYFFSKILPTNLFLKFTGKFFS